MLTLAIGDLFVPDRAMEIPPKFRSLLAPNPSSVPANSKINQVLCLGNVTASLDTLRFLHNISPEFKISRGEYDDSMILAQMLKSLAPDTPQSAIPLYGVASSDNFRIGFTNGYQIVPRNDPLSLLAFAREIDVDVLVWGGTHKVEAYTLDGKFFVNPGSATGAFSFDWPELEIEDEDEEDKEDEDEDAEGDDEHEAEKLKHDIKQEKQENESSEKPEQEDDKEKTTGEKNATDSANSNLAHIEERLVPSFCLLGTQGSKCTLYIYTYIDDEVKVDKVIYQKQ